MSSKSATVHNPSNFEPRDYEVLDYLDNAPDVFYAYLGDEGRMVTFRAEMAQALGADWASKAYHCAHCGNGNVRYITVTRHIPTGERVVFGADCTARLGFIDRMAFKLAQLRSKAEAGHARLKVWQARERFLAANPAVAIAIEQAKAPAHARNSFVQDVLSKLNQYGSLSERQVAAVLQSLARDVETAKRKAVEATEVKGEGPVGRVTVTGEVLSVQQRETDFGTVTKMLLKLQNNAKAWLTVPAGSGIERGQTVTVTATFEQSRDDKSFSFGKRPFLGAPAPKTAKARKAKAAPVVVDPVAVAESHVFTTASFNQVRSEGLSAVLAALSAAK